MRKVILHVAYEMNRAKAFAFAGYVFQQMETAPARPKEDFPILLEWADCRCIYKLTKAGTHVLTIEPLNPIPQD